MMKNDKREEIFFFLVLKVRRLLTGLIPETPQNQSLTGPVLTEIKDLGFNDGASKIVVTHNRAIKRILQRRLGLICV